jgi:hypothetical protein
MGKPEAQPQRKRFSIARVLLLLVIVVVAYAVWNWLPSKGRETVGRIVGGGEQVVVDEEFGVPAKSWQGRGFKLRRPAEVEVQVQCAGDGVNVYVVSEADYKQFESAQTALFGGEYRHYPAFHMLRATRNTQKGRLGEGTYYVIVENPTYGILTKANFNVHLKVIGRP